MVYCNLHITGVYHPLYTLNNMFFMCFNWLPYERFCWPVDLRLLDPGWYEALSQNLLKKKSSILYYHYYTLISCNYVKNIYIYKYTHKISIYMCSYPSKHPKKKEKSLQTKYLNVLISSIKTPQKKKQRKILLMCFLLQKKKETAFFGCPGHLAATLVPSTSKKRPVLLWVEPAPRKNPEKTPKKGTFQLWGKKKNGEIPEVCLCFFVCFLGVWNCESCETDDDFLGYYMVCAETSIQWLLTYKMKGNWSTDFFDLCSTASHSHQKPSRSPTLEIDLILQKV